MRTIQEIKKIITDSILQNETFQALGFDPNQTWDSQVSATNIINLIAFICAFAIWSLEGLFSLHKNEVDAIIADQRAHTRTWYRNKALDFQYGRALVDGQDYYDNTGLTDEEIEAEKIVSHSAVTENDTGSLNMKVAREVDGELAPLSEADPDQLSSFIQYFENEQDGIKDAGVNIIFVNNVADELKLVIDIYYNPLVLNAAGERIDGTNSTPVNDAAKNYLRNLPFNGEYSNMALVDSLQAVEGVEIPELLSSSARYGINDWAVIDAKYNPDAGYLRIYNEIDLVITYKPYDV